MNEMEKQGSAENQVSNAIQNPTMSGERCTKILDLQTTPFVQLLHPMVVLFDPRYNYTFKKTTYEKMSTMYLSKIFCNLCDEVQIILYLDD